MLIFYSTCQTALSAKRSRHPDREGIPTVGNRESAIPLDLAHWEDRVTVSRVWAYFPSNF